MPTPPQRGNFVRVRSRLYLVDNVADSGAEDDAVVHLSCLDEDAQGARLSVLWQSEVDARVIDPANWRDVAARGLDAPHTFAAYLHAQRWNCVTSTRPRLFQSPHRAGIELHPYQLEPLRKALLLPRVNLFIADDVGLGKTIEAGLILRELLMRQRVRRVQYQREEPTHPKLLRDPLEPVPDDRDLRKFKAQRSLRDVEPSVDVYLRQPGGRRQEQR